MNKIWDWAINSKEQHPPVLKNLRSHHIAVHCSKPAVCAPLFRSSTSSFREIWYLNLFHSAEQKLSAAISIPAHIPSALCLSAEYFCRDKRRAICLKQLFFFFISLLNIFVGPKMKLSLFNLYSWMNMVLLHLQIRLDNDAYGWNTLLCRRAFSPHFFFVLVVGTKGFTMNIGRDALTILASQTVDWHKKRIKNCAPAHHNLHTRLCALASSSSWLLHPHSESELSSALTYWWLMIDAKCTK